LKICIPHPTPRETTCIATNNIPITGLAHKNPLNVGLTRQVVSIINIIIFYIQASSIEQVIFEAATKHSIKHA
jgi:hypothetical protein